MNAVQDIARVRETVHKLTRAPAVDAAQAIERARAALAPSLADRQAPAYPVAALGPLAPACEAIASAGQVQPAMAGQCLLGAASLLTQGLYNVETLNGARPLSLNLKTLGDSGDGKSTAQGVALHPVNEWQRNEARRFAAELQDFDSKTGGRREKGEAKPVPPRCPYRLVADPTVEGLRRDFVQGVCSQGVFNDEAASVLAGYGMTPEHRAKSAAVYSKLWDSGHVSASRVTGGRVEKYGCRITLHWLIQPMAAAESVGDPMLSALGFWPRFLTAWPAPQAPRLARPFLPDTLPAVCAYWDRCGGLLAEPLPDDATGCMPLPLSSAARSMLGQAFEAFEREARLGAMRGIKPFALRASEQACRVSGVLTAFAGRHEVTVETMHGALALVAYSLKTWQSLIEDNAADPAARDALRLYSWLTTRPDWSEKLAVIVNGGPTRSKDKRDAALSVLKAAGLVAVSDGVACALIAPEG